MQEHGAQAGLGPSRDDADPGKYGMPFRYRAGLVLAVLGILAIAFRHRLQALDLAAVAVAYEQVSTGQWALALALTGLSFWAVGRYDRVIHRVIGTGTPDHGAGRSGMIAIAIGQTVGFGVVTGAFLRWRLRPELGLWQATRVSALVALSFMAGLAVTTAGIVAITGLPAVPGARTGAFLVLAVAMLLPIAAVFPPSFLARYPLLPARAMAAILTLTMIDCGAAALALYVLMPADIGLGFVAVLSAFLLALGAGIATGTPGGVGPFEVVLLTLLPAAPQPSLIAAILAFRLVYYAIPAVLAATFAVLTSIGKRRAETEDNSAGLQATTISLHRDHPLPDLVTAPLANAYRAEAHLVRESGLVLARNGIPLATLANSSGALVMLRDPWNRRTDGLSVLRDLRSLADQRMNTAFLYKVGNRIAVAARTAGWRVVAIAAEAWLDPRRYSIDCPERRQLRRKLRKADMAGLQICDGTEPLPIDEMAEIAADWAASHRGERGFSMGRFALDDLNAGLVYLARSPCGRIEGFVTFHAVARERALDLMRYRSDAPDGTMHALVHHAIVAAQTEGCHRLSLAAIPTPDQWLPRRIAGHINAKAAGLIRFKASFAPSWEPLYAAAPGWLSLFCGLASVFNQINVAGRLASSTGRHGSRSL